MISLAVRPQHLISQDMPVFGLVPSSSHWLPAIVMGKIFESLRELDWIPTSCILLQIKASVGIWGGHQSRGGFSVSLRLKKEKNQHDDKQMWWHWTWHFQTKRAQKANHAERAVIVHWRETLEVLLWDSCAILNSYSSEYSLMYTEVFI